MADVIGTVSACLAVAETGLKVAKAIRERVHRSKTVRQEVSRITVILDSYQILLEALRAEASAEVLENDNVNTQSRLTSLCAADGPLAACSEALTALEKRLSHVSGFISTGKIIDARTSAALSCLQEARLVLELALASDQRTIAKNVHNVLGTLQSYIHEMRSESRTLFKTTARMAVMVQALMHQTDAGNRKLLLDNIFSGNVADRWRSNVSGIKADSRTCSWFFDSSTWEKCTSSSGGVLWVIGPSGVGKTVLLSLAISKLQMLPKDGDRDIVCAYFFFDFNMNDMQRPDYMARSLIQQLVSGPASALLDDVYANYFSGDSAPNFIRCRDILQEIVDALCAKSKVFFVIDALDEATDLADVFKYLPTLQHCNVILSSQELLCRQYSIPAARMVAMNVEEITPDIQSYVEQRLENDSALHRLSDDRKNLIKKGIMEKSQGMFRLAQCQLDYISRLSDKRAVRLREVLQKLPNALNGIYQNHIDRIFDYDGRQVVLRLLFLLARFRTLRVAEVAEYLAFSSSDGARKPEVDDLFDEEEVIELGGRFVRITRLPDGGVGLSLAHTTVATFLRDTYSVAETSAQVSAYCEQYFHLPVDLEQLRQSATADLGSEEHDEHKDLYPLEGFTRYSQAVWRYLDANLPLHRLCSRALRRDPTSAAARLHLRASTDEARPPLWYICYLNTFLSADPPGECLKYLLCFLPKASNKHRQRWTRGIVTHVNTLLVPHYQRTTTTSESSVLNEEHLSQPRRDDYTSWPAETDLHEALGDDWRALTFHTRAYTLLVCYVDCVVRFVGRPASDGGGGDSFHNVSRWGEGLSSLQRTFTTVVRPGNDFSSKLRLTMLRRKLAQGLRQMLKDLTAAADGGGGGGGGGDSDSRDALVREEAVCEHILKWAGRGQGKFEWPDVKAAA